MGITAGHGSKEYYFSETLGMENIQGFKIEPKKQQLLVIYETYRNKLTLKQNEFIDLYYFKNFNMREIGEKIGITRQAVRFRLINAVKRLIRLKKEGRI